jgi:hypothetical protein
MTTELKTIEEDINIPEGIYKHIEQFLLSKSKEKCPYCGGDGFNLDGIFKISLLNIPVAILSCCWCGYIQQHNIKKICPYLN